MESKFTEFSRDSSFGLSAHFTIKLKEASALFQSEPYRLKTETQEIELYRVPFEVSAILFTVHYFGLFRMCGSDRILSDVLLELQVYGQPPHGYCNAQSSH
ncbi:hypothetical protein, partial [Gillisia limnaea]|uniref:hypothetical protein n=1 Tax=Gillisia limnaea TaxID=195907 RepID=UPI00058BC792